MYRTLFEFGPNVCEFIIIVRQIFVSAEFRTRTTCFCLMKHRNADCEICTWSYCHTKPFSVCTFSFKQEKYSNAQVCK